MTMIQIRIFVEGRVRYRTLVSPQQYRFAMSVIREQLCKVMEYKNFTVVAEQGNLATIVWRQPIAPGRSSYV